MAAPAASDHCRHTPHPLCGPIETLSAHLSHVLWPHGSTQGPSGCVRMPPPDHSDTPLTRLLAP
eukprot:135315-Pyramimonas_sp.AAC.1